MCVVQDATLNFAGFTPSLSVNGAAVGVEQFDLYIVGQCSDTVCLIPIRFFVFRHVWLLLIHSSHSDIINPIAQNLIPDLEKVESVVQKSLSFARPHVCCAQAIVTEVNTAGNAALSKLADVRRVPLSNGWALLLDSEGGLTVNSDGSVCEKFSWFYCVYT